MSDESVASIPATSPEWPSIAQFYSQRDVFVTGATGFLGKCLVEKLIRSIPDIGRVMILIRPKRGKTVKERLDALLSSKVRTDTPSRLLCNKYKYIVSTRLDHAPFLFEEEICNIP